MDIDRLIAEVDAEIRDLRAEMIRHIDEHVLPAMVARRLLRLESGERESPAPVAAPVTAPPAPQPAAVAETCLEALLRVVTEAGRLGIGSSALRARLRTASHKGPPVEEALQQLQRTGTIVFDRFRWRLSVEGDPVPLPARLQQVVDERQWKTLEELVHACLWAWFPDPLRLATLKHVAEAAGYAPGSAAGILNNLRKKGLVGKTGLTGMWHLPDHASPPRAKAPRPEGA